MEISMNVSVTTVVVPNTVTTPMAHISAHVMKASNFIWTSITVLILTNANLRMVVVRICVSTWQVGQDVNVEMIKYLQRMADIVKQ